MESAAQIITLGRLDIRMTVEEYIETIVSADIDGGHGDAHTDRAIDRAILLLSHPAAA